MGVDVTDSIHGSTVAPESWIAGGICFLDGIEEHAGKVVHSTRAGIVQLYYCSWVLKTEKEEDGTSQHSEQERSKKVHTAISRNLRRELLTVLFKPYWICLAGPRRSS